MLVILNAVKNPRIGVCKDDGRERRSTMTEYLASAAPAMGNHLWQATAFAAVAGAATLLLRRNRARVRYGLWLAASVKFLVPFSLLVGLGGLLPRPQRAVMAMPVYSAVDTAALPFAEMPVEVAPVKVHVSPMQRFEHLLPVVVAVVWLCGALVVLLVWGGRWRQVARTVRRAVRAEDGREVELLRRVEAAMGGRERVPLVLSREQMEPGIFGVFRTVLIWPERLSERLDDEHIAAILMHELMHVRRRDNLTAALHMLVEAAFWFHPMVWWMGARMVEERERACDEAVVEMGSRPGIYAESLLKAVRFCVESPLACVAGITGADLNRRVRSIMTLRLERMTVGKKMVLAALGFLAIAAPVAFGIVRMVPMYGQILHASGPLPSFEVATIKPLDPMRFVPPSNGGAPPAGRAPNGEQIVSQQELRFSKGPSQPSNLVNSTMTAKMLIDDAYNLPAFSKAQIVGGPEWTDQTMYRIQAKIDDAQYAAMQQMPSSQRVQQIRLMEQSLLAERFKLKVHFETREMPVYALEVAKGGPKLTQSVLNPTGVTQAHPTGMTVVGKGDGSEIKGNGVSPGQLILLLQQQPEVGNRMVVDKTGLKGNYDFSLDWTREGSAGADDGSSAVDAGPSFFTALKEQLGLQLVETKGPVEVIVIDHIERPSVDGAEVSAPQAVPGPSQTVPVPAPVAAPAKLPEFDAATIKPANPKNSIVGMFTYPGGRILCTNCTLQYLAMEAFGLQAWQISGGPSWVDDVQYDVEAKPPISSAASKLNNPIIKTPPSSEQREMLQSLLMDRFQLKIHRVPKEGPVYILSRGDKPLKLEPPKDKDGFSWAGRVGGGVVTDASGLAGTNISMPQLTARLSGFLNRPVLDETGIAGSFDFKYESGDEDPNSDVASGIAMSLREIGLKLAPGKGPVESIVIDHIERPSAN